MFMLNLNSKLLQGAFPINKVEVFFDDLDHSNFLGYTWEMVSQGRFPVGLDTNDTDFNIIGKTGGEKTHTLTVNEMPKHSHDTTLHSGGSQGLLGFMGLENGSRSSSFVGGTRFAIENKGNSQPHNNVPPYIVMAFWRRIA